MSKLRNRVTNLEHQVEKLQHELKNQRVIWCQSEFFRNIPREPINIPLLEKKVDALVEHLGLEWAEWKGEGLRKKEGKGEK